MESGESEVQNKVDDNITAILILIRCASSEARQMDCNREVQHQKKNPHGA